MATTANNVAKGFFVPAPEMEFIYYLMKKVDKGTITEGQFRHLQSQFKQCPEQCLNKMLQFWSLEVSKKIFAWIGEGDCLAVQTSIPLLRDMLAKRGRPSANERWREFKRKVRRVLQPTGIVVALLGPDGCGKSTIGEGLQVEISPAFRGLSCFHLRPSFLGRRSSNEPVTNPHAKGPRGYIASIAKLLFFFLDYTGGYWLRIRPLKVRSHFVLFDRYYQDMFMDPVRYRYGAPMWVARLMGLFLPEPDLFLVLDAPSEIIQTRKKEVPLAEATRQRQAYLSFARSRKNCIVVNTDQTVESAVEEARMAVLAYMEKRLQRRMGKV